jgi:nucleotide-binding universal stress UspA family protein
MTDPQIVCGVDGSPCSLHAAAVAAALADEMRGCVVLVHVLPRRPSMTLAAVPVGAHPVTSAAMHELDRRESEAAFAAAEGELDGLPVDRVVEKGSPPARIAAVALERDAILIVVGTRSRGPAGAALLGSVSRELVLAAPGPSSSSRRPISRPEPDGSPQARSSAASTGPTALGVHSASRSSSRSGC